MNDFILVDGDMALFSPSFGLATVVVRPARMTGSGPAKVTGKTACVSGDEGRVSVPGCLYFTGQYSIPGTGTLSISTLGSDQKSNSNATGGKKLLLKGSRFTTKFTVSMPAKQPTPSAPIPDPTPSYAGTGSFAATAATVKAG